MSAPVLVATQAGLYAAAAFAFLAGAVAAYVVGVVGRAIDRLTSDDTDPFDDPKNWH
jgi:hypothetical protein